MQNRALVCEASASAMCFPSHEWAGPQTTLTSNTIDHTQEVEIPLCEIKQFSIAFEYEALFSFYK